MSRYIRVRSTRAQGCHRAGIFHGVQPVVYDTHELTPDQVRLLKAEDGRLLLVDDVDGPEAAGLAPEGGGTGPGEQFTSHPDVHTANTALRGRNDLLVRDLAREEERRKAAEARADSLAAQVAKLLNAPADTQGESDAPAKAGKAPKGRSRKPAPAAEPAGS
ncbi:MAG: hypothetical protein OXP66_02345 [Candidatus Tectomicrobia bacterium]|nr:hypothetical protein [Candidatus Tectomicrobia bacterium]